MNTMHRTVMPALLAALAGIASAAPPDVASQEKTVVAMAAGGVGGGGKASEAVVFSGQATISGKVIYDNVFGAPPVLEIIVDLSAVKGKGVQSGKAYLVSSQTILHRPLLAFDPLEVSFPFAADGNVLQARSARASFGVYYNAAKGMSTTPVVISQSPN